MPLVSIANGNFTAAATWGTTATVNDSEIAAHPIGTSATTFGAFVPGAITIDRYAIKLAQRLASPTGTFTATLRNITLSSDAITVTVNVSDLPPAGTANGSIGWICFKLAAPVLLIAGNQYAFRLSCSNAGSQVTVYSANAIAGNGALSSLIVTTTTGAPSAGMEMHICGEYTGAGTGNNITVTMNETATTAYGSGTAQNAAKFTVNGKGILSYGTTAATNYVLRLSTTFRVYSGGTFNMGSSGAEIPRDSTAVLEFPNIGESDYGIYVDDGGTFNCAGLSRTVGKEFDRCYLNTDEAAAQTVLGVDTDTGWLADEIVIASTTQTGSQTERRTISGTAGASSITVTAGLTNAHSGTSPTQAEVILLTRNVKLRSTSATLMSYCRVRPTATVNISWSEFRYMSALTSQKSACLYLETTTGSVTASNCSFYDNEGFAVQVVGAATNNYTIQNCVGYINSSGFFSNAVSTGTTWTVDNCWCITTGAGIGFTLGDAGGTVTDNVAVGCVPGFSYQDTGISGTISGLTAHSNSGGFTFQNEQNGITLSNTTAWRNTSHGFNLTGSIRNAIFNGVTFFGNATYSILTSTVNPMSNVLFTGVTSNGDTTFATANGIAFAGSNANYNFVIENSTFSAVSGIKTAHTTDIAVGTAETQMYINSTTLAAATEISGQTTMIAGSFVRIQKKDATTTNHSTLMRYGTLALDASVFNTAAPSLKMTPNNASIKLESATVYNGWKAAVNNGGTITAAVYINKNASYNGAQPRLIVRKNYAAGITADTVLATYTAGTGSWNQISGTTAAVTDNAVLEFIVDCDGTAGYISVDDFTVS